MASFDLKSKLLKKERDRETEAWSYQKEVGIRGRRKETGEEK